MDALIPGSEPPFVMPYCWDCRLPAYRVVFDIVSSPYYIGVHAQCCNRTSSVRVPIEDMYRMRATNEKYYVLTPKNRMHGLRELPKSEFSYTRAAR